MQSVKSCFNSTLFLKNLTRFWPIWGLYGLILLMLPGGLFLMANSNVYGGALAEFADEIVPMFSAYTAVPLAGIFGILAAMATFSYLFSSRSAGLMHTLPLRREGLFLTSYLSGLCYFLIPLVAVFLITLLGEAIAGYVNIGTLATWLLTQILCTLFFYSLGVFCAMFTGHLLALPLFYLLLNALAMIVYGIATLLFSQTLYGFSSLPDGLQAVTTWLTPATKLMGVLIAEARAGTTGYLGWVALYAVVGVILAALALLVYRRRHVEHAGDIVAVSWVRPIFRYGFAALFACIFGSILYSIFAAAALASDAVLILFLVICGVIGYFLAEMLLQKSFRVFQKWKGCAVFTVCVIICSCLLVFDATGYETRVPAPETVESVTFFAAYSAPDDSAQGMDCTVDDPETVAMLLRLHQSLLAQRDSEEARGAYSMALDDVSTASSSPWVSYTLSDGSILHRRYTGLTLAYSDLDSPDSLASQIQALLNRPDVISSMYGATIGGEYTPLTEIPAGKVSSITLNVYAVGDDAYITRECPVGADRERLWNAVLADFAEGNLGRRYLFWSDSEWLEQTYANEFAVAVTTGYDEDGWSTQCYTTITLTPDAVHTIAVLKELGLLDDDHVLITNADADGYGYGYGQ